MQTIDDYLWRSIKESIKESLNDSITSEYSLVFCGEKSMMSRALVSLCEGQMISSWKIFMLHLVNYLNLTMVRNLLIYPLLISLSFVLYWKMLF